MSELRSPSATAAEQLDAALIQAVLETTSEAGLLWLVPPGEHELTLTALLGVNQQIVSPWARMPLSASLPTSDAAREGRIIWLSSQEEMARRYPAFALSLPYPFAILSAPISRGTTVFGALALAWAGSHPPRLTPEERAAVRACCDDMALIMQRAADAGHPVRPPAKPRLLASKRSHTPTPAEAQAAVDFAERLPGGSCTLDPQGRFTFVTATAADLFGADPDDLLDVNIFEALPWLDDAVTVDRLRAATIGHEATSFTVLRPPNHWLALHLYPDALGISIRMTAAPSGGESDPRDPDPHDEVMPAPPAPPGRAAALSHVTQLATALTQAIGVRDVVEHAADKIMSAFRTRSFALMTAEDGRLQIIGCRGAAAEAEERFDGVPLASDIPATRVLSTGVPLICPTIAEMQREFPGLDPRADTAWAFLPLISSGRPIGTLVLGCDPPYRFPEGERALLTALAGLIAQALDRAVLYDTSRELARSVQANLLPHALPHVPGLDVAARYLPATRGMDVGGDFYDLIRLGDGAGAVTIGDVQGHSVNAAVLMGQVRTAVHATADQPPGEVLARTNRLLTDLDSGLFTSCLHVRLDLAGHRAHLASAGHPPPLLRHPDGRCDVLDLPHGLLLGIDPTATYPTTEIPLPPGSVLALYTDGLVESPGTDLDDATAHLAGQLGRAGRSTVNALADRLVHRAAQSEIRSDDIAVLLIQTSAVAPAPPGSAPEAAPGASGPGRRGRQGAGVEADADADVDARHGTPGQRNRPWAARAVRGSDG